MASFGSSMPIAREGTTIPGACHLGVLSVVEEEGASPGPVQTAGSMEKCQRCRFRDPVILRGAARGMSASHLDLQTHKHRENGTSDPLRRAGAERVEEGDGGPETNMAPSSIRRHQRDVVAQQHVGEGYEEADGCREIRGKWKRRSK
jgi:hypothetical protein